MIIIFFVKLKYILYNLVNFNKNTCMCPVVGGLKLPPKIPILQINLFLYSLFLKSSSFFFICNSAPK